MSELDSSAPSEQLYPQQKKFNYCYLVSVTVIVTLGNFVGGYQIGVFNTCQREISKLLSWGDNENMLISIMTALMPLGAVVGSLCAGLLSNRIGRKNAMVLTDLVMILSALLVCATQNVINNSATFGVARFLGGAVAGMCLSIAPVYGDFYIVKEVVPLQVSGLLGSFVQFQITLGILVSYAMGVPLPWYEYNNDNTTDWWRAMFLFPAFIAFIQIFLLEFIVKFDSPQWLREHGKPEDAEKHLRKIYTPEYYSEASALIRGSMKPIAENSVISKAICDELDSNHPGFGEMLKPEYRKRLMLACGVSVFQQLSGINMFIFYSSHFILSKIFCHSSLTNVYTTILGAANLVSTLLSFPLVHRNRSIGLGRKLLLLQGCVGMAICLFILGLLALLDHAPIIQLIIMLFYITFFETSVGPITWIYASDMLPDRGVSLVVVLNWVFAAIVGFSFPFISTSFMKIYGTFWLYSGLCMLATGFVAWFVVESKGKTQEEIQDSIEGS